MQEISHLQQQLQEYQFILSKISHEIRNPVTLINSELQLMAARHPEITDHENWNPILEHLEYLMCLLKDLSDYSNSGKLFLRQTEPSSFLQKILTSIQPTYDYLGITLEVDIDSPLPDLQIDSLKIQQAIFNLLRNARESICHARGIIKISAKPYQSGICISIKDNGHGMSSEQKEKIFLPFVTYKSEGTGLGLSITRQIIEAHHGRLELYDSTENGTEFRIFLG